MTEYIVAIAGGSGSGKSTLAYMLKDRFPDNVEMLHFDDYQKNKSDLPVHHGMPNWDHPDSINWEQLLQDLKTLKSGKAIEIQSWASRENPDYSKGRVPITVQPKKILILEGYLSMHHEEVRDLIDFSMYLEMDFEKAHERRDKFKDVEYTEKILKPMHEEFVHPTRKHVDLVVNVEHAQTEHIFDLLVEKLKEEGILG